MNDNSIRFGDYVAEPRDNGDYYLHHPNGGGAMATLAEVAAIKGIIKEREYSAWLQGECDKAVDALYKCNAEVAALRAQLHTEIEQRQFVGDLITNMPHARLAAEFEEFKAEVADALAALREGYALRADGEGTSIPWLAATDLARQELDATMNALGLGAKEK